MKLTDLKLNEQNPRYIEDDRFEALVKSIKEFPKMLKLRPIIYEPKTKEILAGNMRFRALLQMGYETIPDEWVRPADELTEDEARRFIIMDNEGFGRWDFDMLANEWDEKELEDWGFSGIPDMKAADPDEGDPFDDNGVQDKNQYGVIIICDNESAQEKAFQELTEQGYNCKVVVT